MVPEQFLSQGTSFVPKPCLLTRPSGLYVRFWIPRDMSSCLRIGSIARSLHGQRGDAGSVAGCGPLQGVRSPTERDRDG